LLVVTLRISGVGLNPVLTEQILLDRGRIEYILD